jgi:hypothetical protein
MKRPLSDRIHLLQRLITQALTDINYLLATYPEEEAKPFVYLLLEINKGYRAQLRALSKQLKEQRGYDFEGIDLLLYTHCPD